MRTKERFTIIVNYMTPGVGVLLQARDHVSHMVKMHYFFKNLLLYFQAQIRQTKGIVMMSEERYTKVVKCMTPGQAFLCWGMSI